MLNKQLPDTAALSDIKWRYYQYAANCALFNREAERVGQWFVNRYVKSGAVYTTGGGTIPLYYCEDARLCWRTIRHWLDQHHYINTAPQQVREV